MDQSATYSALNTRLIAHPGFEVAPDAWRGAALSGLSLFKTAFVAAALCMATLHTMANAGMPVNPERPLSVETCEEALKRLKEAEAGSPLVSREENRKILEKAKAKAAELCK
jgi:hypothetical protein